MTNIKKSSSYNSICQLSAKSCIINNTLTIYEHITDNILTCNK
ncbi:MAG: hypothetical protein AAFO15_00890 [Pseudomonadota bacterium]